MRRTTLMAYIFSLFGVWTEHLITKIIIIIITKRSNDIFQRLSKGRWDLPICHQNGPNNTCSIFWVLVICEAHLYPWHLGWRLICQTVMAIQFFVSINITLFISYERLLSRIQGLWTNDVKQMLRTVLSPYVTWHINYGPSKHYILVCKHYINTIGNWKEERRADEGFGITMIIANFILSLIWERNCSVFKNTPSIILCLFLFP